MENRTYHAAVTIETRDDQKKVIRGHAAVFNTIGDGGWFREQIKPGAFRDSIGVDDVRALFNHDSNYVLGRNTSGSLRMYEDEKGLAVEIDPPDTQFARDLLTLIERGDISQMSFGFEILNESWAKSEGKDPDLRTLEKVKLWDVSPVTFPFYKQTDVSVVKRSHDEWLSKSNTEQPETWKLNLRKKKLNLIGG